MPQTNATALTGGALYGMSAGIFFGVGGAVRGAFLVTYDLPKEVYIFTAGAIGSCRRYRPHRDLLLAGRLGRRSVVVRSALAILPLTQFGRTCAAWVTTADGTTSDFWERNLRFKTDSSDEGPEKGRSPLD